MVLHVIISLDSNNWDDGTSLCSCLAKTITISASFHRRFSCEIITHYNDGIMSAMTSQITGVSIVRSTVGSGADPRKHQTLASLAIERWIPRIKRPFDDVIMCACALFPSAVQQCFAQSAALLPCSVCTNIGIQPNRTGVYAADTQNWYSEPEQNDRPL